MRTRTAIGYLTIAGLLAGRPLRAGVLDSDPPLLSGGSRATVVYRMAPVHYDPGWVDTIVTCTNVGEASAEVALEVFDENDVRRALASTTAPPGRQATFTTASPGEDGEVTVSGLPAIEHGKARVSASSSSLACSAKHRIRSEDGGLKEAPLELLKRVARGS